jgi:hypothetical protein
MRGTSRELPTVAPLNPLHAADAPSSHQIRVSKFAACRERG